MTALQESWKHPENKAAAFCPRPAAPASPSPALPFTEEELEGWFRRGMECIGEGSRRKCFRVPGLPFCVKFYRLPSEYTRKTRLAVKAEIACFRHCGRFNTSCQEWRYHRKLRGALPPALFALFPETVERIRLPRRGWGLAETLLLNADGTPLRRAIDEMRRTADPALRRRLYLAIAALCSRLASCAVRFYDPPNILVQWLPDGGFRLRIVDFEPRERTLFRIPSFLPFLIRMKARRRFSRFLDRLSSSFSL